MKQVRAGEPLRVTLDADCWMFPSHRCPTFSPRPTSHRRCAASNGCSIRWRTPSSSAGAGEARRSRGGIGKAIRLFAPLYVSNECINNCSYCGFSRDNAILRTTLDVDAVEREARYLAAEGFRNVLLVAGEHPRFVSSGYLEDCVRRLAPMIPSVALEVAPAETTEYARLVAAGAEGLLVYQETYDRAAYAEMHTAGPKKDFDWRLACPERAYAGGFRRIGIGALFGERVARGSDSSGAAPGAFAAQLLAQLTVVCRATALRGPSRRGTAGRPRSPPTVRAMRVLPAGPRLDANPRAAARRCRSASR